MSNVPGPPVELSSGDGAGRSAGVMVPERFSYRVKRRLLGPALTNDQLQHERLTKTVALGVLAPDCISSSAYGSEQILIELLPVAAVGAFTLLLPITGIILAILVLLTLSYRQVVMIYTRAGGSYIVARENFGPRVAQIAAVALLIDYVVTVAVQSAAGTVAVVSAVPALGPYSLEITVAVVVLLAYGNLRGIKEAGKAFALPTYLFVLAIGAVIVTGVVRATLGTLPQLDPTQLHDTVTVGHGNGLVMGATVLVLLRAFANGGSSLTGLEAISNGVGAFQRPEGPNARRAMTIMSLTLAFLVGGVSLLAYLTHATPYAAGYPSVISQEAQLVFGDGGVGHVLFIVVQAATALVLFTGANTSFNGFPFLASFVAEDAFLPRQLRRRGHRLVFSNAIILLTGIAVVLLLVTGAKVNALVPFYAIGVFTGFTMAGLGMARHHHTHRQGRWRAGIAINGAAGLISAVVVAIFAVAKFTEGAWAVVVVFPILVFALIRLNREYREEAAVLRDETDGQDPAGTYSHHTVLVFVDTLDLATLEALRYASTLRPSSLRAVHFVLDSARAHLIEQAWRRSKLTVPLELVDTPDRRLGAHAVELVSRAAGPRTEVSVVLPRRSFTSPLARLLHDRTADRIARLISTLPHAVAIIVPFDTAKRLTTTTGRTEPLPAAPARHPEASANAEGGPTLAPTVGPALPPPGPNYPPTVPPTGDQARHDVLTITGRVRTLRSSSHDEAPMTTCQIVSDDGTVTALFRGRRTVPGLVPGARVRLRGRVGDRDGHPVMNSPVVELINDGYDDGPGTHLPVDPPPS
ncbi:MAG: amino acid permease [Mycobacteriaceae bacterium]